MEFGGMNNGKKNAGLKRDHLAGSIGNAYS